MEDEAYRQTNESLSPPHSVTQRDIACACGVHQTTVSLVLRGIPRVGPEMVKRILDTARGLGYDLYTHSAARQLVQRRYQTRVLNQTLGLLFPSNLHLVRYYAEILQGISTETTAREYGLLTYYLPAEFEVAKFTLPPSYRCEQIDGIIALQQPVVLQYFTQQLRAQHGFGDRPIVSLIWPFAGCASVVTDNTGGAYQAMRHLLALGHRHVLQLLVVLEEPFDNRYMVAQRLDGLTRAFMEEGLDPDAHLHDLPTPTGWSDPKMLLPALHQLRQEHVREAETHPLIVYLRAHPEITAVLGWNDACAIRAWYLLRAAGYRVPEDISIIGFDDTDPMPDAEGNNLLTSVHLPLAEMGQLAVSTLMHLAANPQEQPPCLTLPTELIIRASTKPPGIH